VQIDVDDDFEFDVEGWIAQLTPQQKNPVDQIAPGDFDGDGLVTSSDWAALSSCLIGPTGGTFCPDCAPGDADHDRDTDLVDAAVFQLAFVAP
jgi:hypothetical protein